jgi:hypothetical protein
VATIRFWYRHHPSRCTLRSGGSYEGERVCCSSIIIILYEYGFLCTTYVPCVLVCSVDCCLGQVYCVKSIVSDVFNIMGGKRCHSGSRTRIQYTSDSIMESHIAFHPIY